MMKLTHAQIARAKMLCDNGCSAAMLAAAIGVSISDAKELIQLFTKD